MSNVRREVEELRQQISKAERELTDLRAQLVRLESAASSTPLEENITTATLPLAAPSAIPWKWPLEENEYTRYGRQLILPAIGVKGQQSLKSAAILIVGAGGLGCPAAAYLAGAGVGVLGLVDGDVVELSNLHRQIAHSAAKVGMKKVDSLALFCQELNPQPTYVRHSTHLTPQNAQEIVSNYDVVLDCTDHPTSRYLISDICVLLQKPLISASALRTDGQLILLNHPAKPPGDTGGGPCYRCVFPKPPPPDSVISCGEGGILGPVVGVMGILQALEAIKLITSGGLAEVQDCSTPTLLLFSSAGPTTTFRSMRMRSRRKDCIACSASSSLSLDLLKSGFFDYVQFCGLVNPVSILRTEERVTASFYSKLLDEKERTAHLLLDVREREQFNLGSIPGAVNVPFSHFQRQSATNEVVNPEWLPDAFPPDGSIFIVCRVGNDSQIVARKLKELGMASSGKRFIGDIQGGIRAWKQEVDGTIPFL
ncbi:adenylyltransferase [Xylariales sp. PMI_506]|nr:adenylyltransferase [Xylariales sp. PMI_506]